MKRITLNILLAVLLFFVLYVKAQNEKTCSFVVAGHAYGAHDGTNIGLHPPLLEKLFLNKDSTVKRIFLTGDIVNRSNEESWKQVDHELDFLGLESFYVMGNHDNNSIGMKVFEKKHGGNYYSFQDSCGTFIILNSTESDRSISPVQMDFLKNVLEQSSSKRIFIFFHEIIWNSHEKYKNVRSNSRSRYAQMKDHSNFWDEVYPLLRKSAEKEFYLFAGDVGGNPDAIAVFYDQWENITLLASGMGEVEDENYLLVNLSDDTVEFEIVPLNENVQMNTIRWYNVPEKPVGINGPVYVRPGEKDVKYFVTPVWNATSYQWTPDSGMFGNSDSSAVMIGFDQGFVSGSISVSAVNDGFGASEPFVFEIRGDSLTGLGETKKDTEIFAYQNENEIGFRCSPEVGKEMGIRIYNSVGTIIWNGKAELTPGFNPGVIQKGKLPKGLVVLEIFSKSVLYKQKMILY